MATSIYLGMPPENIKNWIIAEAERKYQEMLKTPLHFVAEESNATMSFSIANGTYETSSTGEEGSWTPYNSEDTITLANVGDKVYFRAGSDEGNIDGCFDLNNMQNSQFNINNGKIAAKGNITSLIDRTMKRLSVPEYGYASLFKDCSKLTQTPLLPATQFSGNLNSGYSRLFTNCPLLDEPKYNLSHMSIAQVSSIILYDYAFGDLAGTYQIKCSDGIIIATFDENNYEWTITEG